MATAAARADLAVDLGTSVTRVVARGRGLVVEAPTAVATRSSHRGREVVAVGEDARKMLGRSPAGTTVVRPVRGGVVADFEATEQLLRHLLREAGARGLRGPRLLVCIPSTHTEVERRAVQDAARAAGAREVLLVPTALVAAVGADLPVARPVGSMIVEVGGGRCEAAVTSLGGLVVCRSARVAGDAMDEAIAGWLREHGNLLVGERTAEQLKVRIGCALPMQPALAMRVRGRDLGEGVPREVEIPSDVIAQALAEPVARIRQVVLDTLGQTPPELAADIHDRGIILAGGASRLRELDRALRDETGLPVLAAEQPERCVARGAERLLDDQALLERATLVE